MFAFWSKYYFYSHVNSFHEIFLLPILDRIRYYNLNAWKSFCNPLSSDTHGKLLPKFKLTWKIYCRRKLCCGKKVNQQQQVPENVKYKIQQQNIYFVVYFNQTINFVLQYAWHDDITTWLSRWWVCWTPIVPEINAHFNCFSLLFYSISFVQEFTLERKLQQFV